MQNIDLERLEKQMAFIREIDKEKFIGRQTYLSDGKRKENDAEHAWHMAIMAVLLAEYSNEPIDVLRTVTMLLIHDIVEIDAGDTYAYGGTSKADQEARELEAADRIYNLLPADQAQYLYDIWREFEEQKTPEAKFARTLDNFQPCTLNDVTNGISWVEHGVHLSQVMKRNSNTASGSEALWDYQLHNMIEKHVELGHIQAD